MHLVETKESCRADLMTPAFGEYLPNALACIGIVLLESVGRDTGEVKQFEGPHL